VAARAERDRNCIKPGFECARLPRFDAGYEHGKETNEFAAHEQLRAAAARN
jgi:hypothetical protein